MKGEHGHHRLYVKGTHVSYRRGKRNTYPKCSLVKIQGVDSISDSKFYLGKRLVYIYRASKPNSKGSRIRCIWGRITHSHGNSGVVRANFKTNLPPKTFGASVRVMLYPSNI